MVLKSDNNKRKKIDTNIWKICRSGYGRTLETVKDGVSVNVTLPRLKIPKTTFIRIVYENLSLSIVSVSLPEEVENDLV
jgi:hypothetical protein